MKGDKEMTKNEIIEVFMKEAVNKEHRYSDATISTYMEFINKYLDNLNKDIHDTTERDVRMFLSNYESSSDCTYNLALMSLNALYSILSTSPFVPEGYINGNPCKDIKGVSKPAKKEKWAISDDDFSKLINSCKNARDKAILTFFEYTGVRSEELRNIRYEDYENYNPYDGLKLRVTKGSKERTIYLNDKVLSAIKEYIPSRKNGCEYLFVSNGHKMMDESSLYRTIKCIGKRAKLNDNVIENLSAHSFRHTAILNMINDGINLSTIATVVGHSSIQTTYSYADKRKLDVRNAMLGGE